jgi:hypothetical protein
VFGSSFTSSITVADGIFRSSRSAQRRASDGDGRALTVRADRRATLVSVELSNSFPLARSNLAGKSLVSSVSLPLVWMVWRCLIFGM